MAYTALGKLATLPDAGFDPNAESERAAPQMPDQKMWTSQNAAPVPATAAPAEAAATALPTPAPVPSQ
jgi:hypothetical protein